MHDDFTYVFFVLLLVSLVLMLLTMLLLYSRGQDKIIRGGTCGCGYGCGKPDRCCTVVNIKGNGHRLGKVQLGTHEGTQQARDNIGRTKGNVKGGNRHRIAGAIGNGEGQSRRLQASLGPT